VEFGRLPQNFLVLVGARLIQCVLVVFVVVSIVFVVARVAGDPISYLAPPNSTSAEIAQLKKDEGLDKPVAEQYVDFIWNALRLDLGTSYRTGQPAVTEVRLRLSKTVQLGAAALAFALGVGIPLGVLSALKRGSVLDVAARLAALVGQAIPNFWLGLMLILFFGVRLGWFPTGGPGGIKHLVLPAVTLGALSASAVMRLTRSGMLDVLGSDFIRTARAKGLSERAVILRHALRHALVPVVTLLGLLAGRLIAGAIVVETVFAWPGLGRLMVSSIQSFDYPVVQVGVIFIATAIVVTNTLVDLSYQLIDPRIRLGAV
jgi:peptide/nickel transport system permease protein